MTMPAPDLAKTAHPGWCESALDLARMLARIHPELLAHVRGARHPWRYWRADGQGWADDDRDWLLGYTLTLARDWLSTPDQMGRMSRKPLMGGDPRFARRVLEALATPAVLGRWSTVADDWDAVPDVVGLPDGQVLVLSEERTRPVERADLVSRFLGAGLGPDPELGLWGRFLADLELAPDVLRYVMAWCGRSLLGLGGTRDASYMQLVGEGGTGKSTFAAAITAALGSYGGSMPPAVIAPRPGERNSTLKLTTFASLQGARLVFAPETGADNVVDGELLKAISGGDPIAARWLADGRGGGAAFSYTPGWQLMFVGNEPPKLPDDAALQDRLRAVRFSRVRRGREGEDRQMRAKLTAPDELGHVVRWLVRGAVGFLRYGLPPVPEEMRAETRAQVIGGSPMAAWWDEHVAPAEAAGDGVLADDLLASAKRWFAESGESRGPTVKEILGHARARVGPENVKRIKVPDPETLALRNAWQVRGVELA